MAVLMVMSSQAREAIALDCAGIIFIAPNEQADRDHSLLVGEAKAAGTPIMYALNPSLLGDAIRSESAQNVVTVYKMDTPVGLYNVLCRYCR